ncbi:hypothetical protein Trydic_g10345 [Trypoxylus dichotomus]
MTNIVSHSQRFINNPATVTIEALLGIVAANINVNLMDFGKVVVRRDYNEMQEVKIISGGSSGHEPAFAGFVGKGMLTAAVQGDIFTCAPASEILRTIRELTNEQSLGILIIIPNNSSDRLNFGLAVERAINEGISVKMIVVSDDCVNFKPKEGRGLCGAFLLQKIAGAMSEQNVSLQDIYNECNKLKDDIFSVLLSVKPCSSTEKGVCESCKTIFAKTEMEIGSGLHGERGPMKMSMAAVEHISKMIFEQMTNENIEHRLELEPNVPIVLLINNLGGTSKMEEYIVIKELLKYLKRIHINVIRMFCDRFLTSLDMYGFTVTIMKIRKPEVLEWLDRPCETLSWPSPWVNCTSKEDSSFILKSRHQDVEAIEMRGPRLNKRQVNTLLLVTQFACDALISCEKQLNIMDGETGDGDTGSRLRRGMETLNVELARHNVNLAYPFVFLLSLSRIIEKSMGGTLGCIYSIMLEAAASEFLVFPESQIVTAWLWLYALKKAIYAMATYAESKEGENTMFDPLCTCAAVMEESLTNDIRDVEAFGNGVFAAEETAQKTKQSPRKYPDPGAHAVGIWLRALYEGVKLRCE